RHIQRGIGHLRKQEGIGYQHQWCCIQDYIIIIRFYLLYKLLVPAARQEFCWIRRNASGINHVTVRIGTAHMYNIVHCSIFIMQEFCKSCQTLPRGIVALQLWITDIGTYYKDLVLWSSQREGKIY